MKGETYMTETKDKRKSTSKSKPETLASALVAFHNTRPYAPKNAEGVWKPYADINSVIDAVRGASEHGLTFTQELDFLDEHPHISYVRTILMHESGETRESRALIHVQEKDKANSQRHGSGITYAKRYALCSAFGLPTPDDDADEISDAQAEKDKQEARKKKLADNLPDKQPEQPETPQSNPNAWAQQ